MYSRIIIYKVNLSQSIRRRNHESMNNLTSYDVFYGREREILRKSETVKRQQC